MERGYAFEADSVWVVPFEPVVVSVFESGEGSFFVFDVEGVEFFFDWGEVIYFKREVLFCWGGVFFYEKVDVFGFDHQGVFCVWVWGELEIENGLEVGFGFFEISYQ